MTAQPTTTTKHRMAHGHSRLIWLLDDIEAHLEGLCSVEEAHELILDELVSFTQSFAEELFEHIDEEEAEIFPSAEAIAAGDDHTHLGALDREHRMIEEDVRAFVDTLEQIAADESAWNDSCFRDLYGQVRSIRELLAAHSVHERSFLSQIEHRLNGGGYEV